jgi:WD40 repeat protein
MTRDLRVSPMIFSQTPRAAPTESLGTFWLKHPNDVTDAAFSPDSQTLVTTNGKQDVKSSSGSAHFWNMTTGAEIGSALEFDGPARRAQFTPKGRLVITASDPNLKPDKGSFAPSDAVHVFDVPSRRKSFASLPHIGAVDLISISRDGEVLLAAGPLDHRARLWSLSTGKAVGKPLDHEGGISAAVLSPDGSLAVTAAYDGSVRIWKVETQKEVARPIALSEFRTQRPVDFVAINGEGTRLATADSGGVVRIWTFPAAQPVGTPHEVKAPLSALTFSPDGKLLLTASLYDGVRLWAAEDGSAVGPPLMEGVNCFAAQFSIDGRLILVSTPTGIRVWRSPAE